MSSLTFHLTDEQWALLSPLILKDALPPASPADPSPGRPPLDERLVLDGILWKCALNAAWCDLPAEYPSYQTCYRRYRQWTKSGLFKEILGLLYVHLSDHLGFDLRQALARHYIRIETVGRSIQVIPPPGLPDWLLHTAMVFIGLGFRRLKTTRTLTIVYPNPSRPQGVPKSP